MKKLFTLDLDDADRKLLEELAAAWKVSQSQAVRLMLRGTWGNLQSKYQAGGRPAVDAAMAVLAGPHEQVG
jgi:hypothetical protein